MMAGLADVAPVVPPEQRKPLWLIPNLLSLDAPLVAVAWLYIFAKTWRVTYLPWSVFLALALVVWVIYVSDRLLDASMENGAKKLQARHRFHRKHKRLFRRAAMIVAFLSLLIVTVPFRVSIFGFSLETGLPVKIYELAIVGGLMVAGFFTLSVFSTKEPDEIPYAKNIIAGMAFAYGTAMLAFCYTGFDMWEFVRSRELICFAVLCILNISAIDLWEHGNRSRDPETNATHEMALTLPIILLGGASLVFAAQDHEMTTRPFFYAILTGAALLHILNRNRARFSTEALRVLADVALLIPLLVFVASAEA